MIISESLITISNVSSFIVHELLFIIIFMKQCIRGEDRVYNAKYCR